MLTRTRTHTHTHTHTRTQQRKNEKNHTLTLREKDARMHTHQRTHTYNTDTMQGCQCYPLLPKKFISPTNSSSGFSGRRRSYATHTTSWRAKQRKGRERERETDRQRQRDVLEECSAWLARWSFPPKESCLRPTTITSQIRDDVSISPVQE